MLDRYAGERLMQSEISQDRPVVPGFNTEDLQDTPEITAPDRPVLMPGEAFPMDLLKDKYILNSPGSGVAFNPKLMIMNAIRGDVMDRPVGTGSTLQDAYRRGEPGVVKPGIPDTVRPSDSDDAYIEIMRSGFV